MRKVSGFKASSWLDAKGVRDAVRQASIEPVAKAALLVERLAKQSMRGGRSNAKGRTTYRASAPGAPPNVRTGNLRASVHVSSPTLKGSRFVGPTLEAWYGRLHEFGGRDKKKHPPRPFMRPALAKAKASMPAMFKNLRLRDTQAGQSLETKAKFRRRMP